MEYSRPKACDVCGRAYEPLYLAGTGKLVHINDGQKLTNYLYICKSCLIKEKLTHRLGCGTVAETY